MNEQHAMELVRAVLGITPLSAQHMILGHNSVTYDVTLPEQNVIVRMNQNAACIFVPSLCFKPDTIEQYHPRNSIDALIYTHTLSTQVLQKASRSIT